MKNNFKFLGIIVMVMTIGFSITACNDSSDNNSGSYSGPLIGRWFGIEGDGNSAFITFAQDDPPAPNSIQNGSNSGITLIISGNTLTRDGGGGGSCNFALSDNDDTLTITNSTGYVMVPNGIYRRQD